MEEPISTGSAAQGESNMDAKDWRTKLQPDSRQRNVNMIMETLTKIISVRDELKRTAVRVEEMIHAAATSESDYLRRISLMLLKQGVGTTKTLLPNFADGNQKPRDPVSHSMQSKVHNLRQSLLMPLNKQSHGRQQLSPESIQNTMSSTTVESSVHLPPTSQFVIASTDSMTQSQMGPTNVVDWQEEVYQKIKFMKELYLPELNELYQETSLKCQQHDSLMQMPEKIGRFKLFKFILEQMITFLQLPKSNILPGYKDILCAYERKILKVLHANRFRKAAVAESQRLQHLQQSGARSHCMPQQPQSQIPQSHHLDNPVNQMQPMDFQGSVSSMRPAAVMSMQQGPPLSTNLGILTTQQNGMSALKPGSNLELVQGNAPHQGAAGSLQHITIDVPQHDNMNTFPQNRVNLLEPVSGSLQPILNLVQQLHLMQQQQHEQQLMIKQELEQCLQETYMLHQQFSKQQEQQQSSASPFIVLSPSTSLGPSPVPGDGEKQPSCIFSLPNAGTNRHHQAALVLTPGRSLAIGTPEISTPLLLKEKISATEGPLQCLIKVAVLLVMCYIAVSIWKDVD